MLVLSVQVACSWQNMEGRMWSVKQGQTIFPLRSDESSWSDRTGEMQIPWSLFWGGAMASKERWPPTYSNQIAMASDLIAMASSLRAMASNLIAMASNLIAMASNLIASSSNGLQQFQPKSDGLQPYSNGLQPIPTQ